MPQKQISFFFFFFSDSHGPSGRLTRASLYDLKVPCPHSNSGKRTLAYGATKLFNDLSSDQKKFSTFSQPISKPLNSILPPLSLNYEICSFHAHPLLNIWKIYCAQIAAILFIVIVFHSATTTSLNLFIYI